MRHVGWFSASSIVALAKRATRGGQYDPPHLTKWSRSDALQNRAVLAVNRNNLTTAFSAGPQHCITTHYKRFLVRQRDALSRVKRSERRGKSGSTDDRIDDNVHVRTRRGCNQAVGPGAPRRIAIAIRVCDAYVLWPDRSSLLP